MKNNTLSRTKEYLAWSGMIYRCTNPASKWYHRYGGRGITVCDEWLMSFQAFLDDMGYAPTKEYSLDRIDNNKGYSKENCRWASKQEQSINRSNTMWIEYEGTKKHLSEWSRVLGLSKQVILYRIKKFGITEAFTMPFGRWANGGVK